MSQAKEVLEIPIENLHLSKILLRPIDPEIVSEIAESIKQQGLLQPILVRRLPDGTNEVIFGNHRVDAHKQLGLKTIRAYFSEFTESEGYLAQLTENLQRNNRIDPVVEAKIFEIAKQSGSTEEQIAKTIGKSQQYISARTCLLRLEPEIQKLISGGKIPTEHAYEISKVDDSKRRKILAELCISTRVDPLTLEELRNMTKQSIEELRKDPRVEKILMRDPLELGNQNKARLDSLDEYAEIATTSENVHSLWEWLFDVQMKLELLTDHGIWKRDRCEYFDGDVCIYWSWNHEDSYWQNRILKDGKWRLRLKMSRALCYLSCIRGKKA